MDFNHLTALLPQTCMLHRVESKRYNHRANPETRKSPLTIMTNFNSIKNQYNRLYVNSGLDFRHILGKEFDHHISFTWLKKKYCTMAFINCTFKSIYRKCSIAFTCSCTIRLYREKCVKYPDYRFFPK